MKFWTLTLLITLSIHGVGLGQYGCDLVDTIFNSPAFYDAKILDLSYADSITILDKSGTFYNCKGFGIRVKSDVLNSNRVFEGDTIHNKMDKFITLRRVDILPYPRSYGLYDKPDEIPKYYSNYFIFYAPESLGAGGVRFHWYKLLTNHSGYFDVSVVDGHYKVEDYEVGQH